VQAVLSFFSQNPVPEPVQQLSGTPPAVGPDVQAASVGGGSTLNVISVVQKFGLFAGMIIVGVGGLTEERGALNNS
jgi:hypothetical protein